MSDYWFTADWHLGHDRIIEFCDRPFASLDEMHEGLIERHNAVVRPNDRVWVLGDACMGRIDESLALVSRFNGIKYLIAGNHDRCFHGYGDNRVNRPQLDAWVARYRAAGFALVVTGFHLLRNGFGTLVELRPPIYTTRNKRRGGIQAELSHFPTTGESRPGVEDRYRDYRPRPLGGVDRRAQTRRWVLHGHVHDAWLSAGRNLNVGVDRWDFTPVSLDDVTAYVAETEELYGDVLNDPAVSTVLGPARTSGR